MNKNTIKPLLKYLIFTHFYHIKILNLFLFKTYYFLSGIEFNYRSYILWVSIMFDNVLLFIAVDLKNHSLEIKIYQVFVQQFLLEHVCLSNRIYNRNNIIIEGFPLIIQRPIHSHMSACLKRSTTFFRHSKDSIVLLFLLLHSVKVDSNQ